MDNFEVDGVDGGAVLMPVTICPSDTQPTGRPREEASLRVAVRMACLEVLAASGGNIPPVQ